MLEPSCRQDARGCPDYYARRPGQIMAGSCTYLAASLALYNPSSMKVIAVHRTEPCHDACQFVLM